MKAFPTAGHWRGTRMRRSTSDWPFDWVSEVTSFDPETGIHHYVATIRQSGARSLDQAYANLWAMTEAAAMARLLQHVGHVLDMTDPEHEAFVDSGADSLDALLGYAEEIRRILSALTGHEAGRTRLADHRNGPCQNA